MQKKLFTKLLLDWFAQNDRPLPWKGEKNPYLIWLSEIILQQTRVEQGLPYFNRFSEKYPRITDLANAPEDEVMKLWEGLGYYSRARNLHFTAKHIAYDLKGVFPKTYKEILKLKGVGPYTAAAIASFAYDLPHAVVDGNVYRVLSRTFGIESAIDSTEGKKRFQALATELLAKKKAAIYNQAIMDFGATQCTPKKPNCTICPMAEHCVAYNNQLIEVLPIKEKKIKKKDRFFNYLIINQDENILIRKRVEKDIWRNLYEFPLIESTALLDETALVQHDFFKELLTSQTYKITNHSRPIKQLLTHQKILASFWEITVNKAFQEIPKDFISIKKENLATFAFPKIVDLYFKDNSLLLF